MKKLLLVVSLALVSVQGAWAADKMLADRHVERGLKCESCHTTMPPKAVNTDGCLKCHVSYEKLAARTDKKRYQSARFSLRKFRLRRLPPRS